MKTSAEAGTIPRCLYPPNCNIQIDPACRSDPQSEVVVPVPTNYGRAPTLCGASPLHRPQLEVRVAEQGLEVQPEGDLAAP